MAIDSAAILQALQSGRMSLDQLGPALSGTPGYSGPTGDLNAQFTNTRGAGGRSRPNQFNFIDRPGPIAPPPVPPTDNRSLGGARTPPPAPTSPIRDLTTNTGYNEGGSGANGGGYGGAEDTATTDDPADLAAVSLGPIGATLGVLGHAALGNNPTAKDLSLMGLINAVLGLNNTTTGTPSVGPTQSTPSLGIGDVDPSMDGTEVSNTSPSLGIGDVDPSFDGTGDPDPSFGGVSPDSTDVSIGGVDPGVDGVGSETTGTSTDVGIGGVDPGIDGAQTGVDTGAPSASGSEGTSGPGTGGGGGPDGEGRGGGPGGPDGGDGSGSSGGGDSGGSGGVGCFVAGTKILMADGTEKAIEDVKIGDMVMAYGPSTIATVLEGREVVGLQSRRRGGLVRVNGTLVVSNNHRFLTADNEFVEIGHLHRGDKIVSAKGEPVEIRFIEREPGEAIVYNFEVADLHVYVAAGFRVHNEKDTGGEVQGPPGLDQVPQNDDTLNITAQHGEYMLSNPFIIALAQMLGTTPEGVRDLLDQMQMQTTGQQPFGMDGAGGGGQGFMPPPQPTLAPNVPPGPAPMPQGMPPMPQGMPPMPGAGGPPGGGIAALQAGGGGIPPRANGGRVAPPRRMSGYAA